jgi:hypothetical protein
MDPCNQPAHVHGAGGAHDGLDRIVDAEDIDVHPGQYAAASQFVAAMRHRRSAIASSACRPGRDGFQVRWTKSLPGP